MSVWDDFSPEQLELIKKYSGNTEFINREDADKKMMDDVKKGLEDVEKAVKELKPKEPTSLDKALDNFLNDGEDVRITTARNKFMKMTKKEQAKIQETNPELFNALFPKEEINIPKPCNYEQYKALLMKNENDIVKLPYNVRLYAMHHDKEFAGFITVADASLIAKSKGNTNPVAKKFKEMQDADYEARQAKEQGK